MAVTANTNETYDVTTIREDLSEAMASISPTETIFMSTIGSRNVDNTYFEWSEVDLAATTANRQIEGDVGLSNTAPTNAVRKGGYTQISAKVVEVSSTNQAVNGVANAQTVAKQVAYKLSELKRDMEAMLLANVAASAGASGTARQTAGLPAYLTSNVSRGSGGANGTTSGTGEAGFVNAAATDGTLRALTEALLKTVIASCWDAGAQPTVVLCGSAQKQKMSTFTGNATRYKEAEDSKLNAAIDGGDIAKGLQEAGTKARTEQLNISKERARVIGESRARDIDIGLKISNIDAALRKSDQITLSGWLDLFADNPELIDAIRDADDPVDEIITILDRLGVNTENMKRAKDNQDKNE